MWWLGYSPPTKASRVRFPAGLLPHYCCRTMQLAGGFSRRSPVSPELVFRSCPKLISLHPHRLSRTRCYNPRKSLHSLQATNRKLEDWRLICAPDPKIFITSPEIDYYVLRNSLRGATARAYTFLRWLKFEQTFSHHAMAPSFWGRLFKRAAPICVASSCKSEIPKPVFNCRQQEERFFVRAACVISETVTASKLISHRSHKPPLREHGEKLHKRLGRKREHEVSLLDSNQGWATRFLHVGIVPDDGTGRRVFSVISRFPRPVIPVPLTPSPSSALKTSIRWSSLWKTLCRYMPNHLQRIARRGPNVKWTGKVTDVNLTVKLHRYLPSVAAHQSRAAINIYPEGSNPLALVQRIHVNGTNIVPCFQELYGRASRSFPTQYHGRAPRRTARVSRLRRSSPSSHGRGAFREAPSLTVGFTRRLHTLSYIQAMKTSLAVVPQSPVVVHTYFAREHSTRRPLSRIFPSTCDASWRAEASASLTRTVLRRRQTCRNLQQGRGVVTQARRRATNRWPVLSIIQGFPRKGPRRQPLEDGRDEASPPPQCRAAARNSTQSMPGLLSLKQVPQRGRAWEAIGYSSFRLANQDGQTELRTQVLPNSSLNVFHCVTLFAMVKTFSGVQPIGYKYHVRASEEGVIKSLEFVVSCDLTIQLGVSGAARDDCSDLRESVGELPRSTQIVAGKHQWAKFPAETRLPPGELRICCRALCARYPPLITFINAGESFDRPCNTSNSQPYLNQPLASPSLMSFTLQEHYRTPAIGNVFSIFGKMKKRQRGRRFSSGEVKGEVTKPLNDQDATARHRNDIQLPQAWHIATIQPLQTQRIAAIQPPQAWHLAAIQLLQIPKLCILDTVGQDSATSPYFHLAASGITQRADIIWPEFLGYLLPARFRPVVRTSRERERERQSEREERERERQSEREERERATRSAALIEPAFFRMEKKNTVITLAYVRRIVSSSQRTIVSACNGMILRVVVHRRYQEALVTDCIEVADTITSCSCVEERSLDPCDGAKHTTTSGVLNLSRLSAELKYGGRTELVEKLPRLSGCGGGGEKGVYVYRCVVISLRPPLMASSSPGCCSTLTPLPPQELVPTPSRGSEPPLTPRHTSPPHHGLADTMSRKWNSCFPSDLQRGWQFLHVHLSPSTPLFRPRPLEPLEPPVPHPSLSRSLYPSL
ncbi:hypothetical protein PR048_027726 [Dryococelus australis]|uniref:Uncharacterized protein n=1 Tax=Dryococelus australis TaxID=614101 RepID=A0ABQ9GHA6_9NEOP|nr:hypothetical protein PR048_027726 [Dryococelus australis]